MLIYDPNYMRAKEKVNFVLYYFDRSSIGPVLLCDMECWNIKKHHLQDMCSSDVHAMDV